MDSIVHSRLPAARPSGPGTAPWRGLAGGLALLLVLTGLAGRTFGATTNLITFDNLPSSSGTITNGYGGLMWTNFQYLTGTSAGYLAGTVTGKVAFNAFGNPATFASTNRFNLLSAYLTAAYNDGLTLSVQGYANGSLSASNSLTLSTTNQFFIFSDYTNLDKIIFTSSGGTPNPSYTHGAGGTEFVMDNLTVAFGVVGIVNQPLSQTACAGSPVTFTVTGWTNHLAYQWWLNTTNPIPGATNNSFTLTNVTPADAATYSVVVSGAYTVTSSPAVLTVNQAPALTGPAASEVGCLGATAVLAVTNSSPTATRYQWWRNATNLIAGATNSSLTLTNLAATNAATYSLVASNGCGMVSNLVAALAVVSPFTITGPPQGQSVCAGSPVEFDVATFWPGSLTNFLTYQWRMNTTNLLAGATNAALVLSNVSTSNVASYDVVVSGGFISVTSSPAALAVNPLPSVTSLSSSQTGHAGAAVTLAVSVNPASASCQWVKNTTGPILGATNTTLTLASLSDSDAATYSVIARLADSCSVTGVVATLAVNDAPYIYQQPTGLKVAIGGNATFTVGAYGAAPLYYQWYSPTGALAAATSTLVLTNVQTNQAGNYSVAVYNLHDSIISSNALLSVIQAPSLTVQLQGGYPLLSVYGPANNSYVVQYKPGPTAGNWADLHVFSNLQASPGVCFDTNPVPAGTTNRFYRAVGY
jgi:hypothetical protein